MQSAYSKLRDTSNKSEARLQHALATGRVRKARIRPGNRTDLANMLIVRPGPLPFPDHLRRSNTVSARFNAYELAELDRQRSVNDKLPYPRGEWLRMAWLDTKPVAVVPEFNRLTHAKTARSAANLAHIVSHIADTETRQQVESTGHEFAKFRLSLTHSQFQKSTDDGIGVAYEDRRTRRGPFPLPPEVVRDHVVCVRLNDSEMSKLNAERGSSMKGEWLRMVWKDLQSAKKIPAVAQSAHDALARSADNLNKIAHFLNSGNGVHPQLQIILDELKNFRICVKRAKESLS